MGKSLFALLVYILQKIISLHCVLIISYFLGVSASIPKLEHGGEVASRKKKRLVGLWISAFFPFLVDILQKIILLHCVLIISYFLGVSASIPKLEHGGEVASRKKKRLVGLWKVASEHCAVRDHPASCRSRRLETAFAAYCDAEDAKYGVCATHRAVHCGHFCQFLANRILIIAILIKTWNFSALS